MLRVSKAAGAAAAPGAALMPLWVAACLSVPCVAGAEADSAAAAPTATEPASTPAAASPEATAAPAPEPSSSNDPLGFGNLAESQVVARGSSSPLRVTFGQELSYKVQEPNYLAKNRVSGQMEYTQLFLDNFTAQFNAKEIVFLSGDHRHNAEGHDTAISQAYLQTSFGRTSIKAGIQTLPWGESILAPITDEVSPRDNREMFNFNLEELRIGQPMLTVDRYSAADHWGFFFVPDHYFNKNPVKGTAYYFDPFTYTQGTAGAGNNTEYGVSWKRSFASADITFMVASLIDNDYALNMNLESMLVTRTRERMSLGGVSFSYAFGKFVLRGEAAAKSPKAFDNIAMQIEKHDELDTYFGLEYAHSSSLTVSLEAVNQHVQGWSRFLLNTPRDNMQLLLNVTKKAWHDDLTINFMGIYGSPQTAALGILTASLKVNDSMTAGINMVYPYASDTKSSIWNVRDQKQLSFKLTYAFQ